MEQIGLITTGFAIVIGVLIGLWAICALVALAFKVKPASPNPTETIDDEIPAHHVAAITAAIAAVMSGAHQIVKIDAPPHVVPGWGESSMIELSFSHRTHWDWKIPGPPHIDNNTKETKGK